jgi:hypothetical protein
MIYNVIGVPSQALQIIFEMQIQGTSQKELQRKYVFSNYKMCFDLSYFQIS